MITLTHRNLDFWWTESRIQVNVWFSQLSSQKLKSLKVWKYYLDLASPRHYMTGDYGQYLNYFPWSIQISWLAELKLERLNLLEVLTTSISNVFASLSLHDQVSGDQAQYPNDFPMGHHQPSSIQISWFAELKHECSNVRKYLPLVSRTCSCSRHCVITWPLDQWIIDDFPWSRSTAILFTLCRRFPTPTMAMGSQVEHHWDKVENKAWIQLANQQRDHTLRGPPVSITLMHHTSNFKHEDTTTQIVTSSRDNVYRVPHV